MFKRIKKMIQTEDKYNNMQWKKGCAILLILTLLPWNTGYFAYANTFGSTESAIESQSESVEDEEDIVDIEAETVVEDIVDTQAETDIEEINEIEAVGVAAEVKEELRDWTVSGSTTLYENKEINNLVLLQGAKLNLNGYELTVNGEFKTDGIIYFNKGTLNVFESMTAENNAIFYMNDANDEMCIAGDVHWNVKKSMEEYMKLGTMTLGGNLTSSVDSLFRTGQDFKVKFNGDSGQEIKLPGDMNQIGVIEILNNSEEGLYSEDYFGIYECIDHGHTIHYAEGNGIHGFMVWGSQTIEGDVILNSGTLEVLYSCKLTINGNLIQRGGEVLLDGDLIVNGDYRIQTPLEVENTSENEEKTESGVVSDSGKTYGISYGKLNMTSRNARLTVKGNFIDDSIVDHTNLLTAGYMYLYKDMTILDTGSKKNFVASDSHSVVIKGDGEHKIIFPETDNREESRICSLQIDSSVGNIEFVNCPYVTNYLSSKKSGSEHYKGYITVGDTTRFSSSKYDGNVILSYEGEIPSVTIGGDTILKSTTKINSLRINGNLLVDMEKNSNLSIDNQLIVGGDLDIPEYTYIQYGRIFLAGDLKNLYYFTGLLTLNGTGRQEITTKEYNTFGTINIENTSEEGVHSNYPLNAQNLNLNGNKLVYGDGSGVFGWKLDEDEVVDSDLVLYGETLDLNGHTLTVNGDFVHLLGQIDLNNGTLIIKGSYKLCNTSSSNIYSKGILIMDDELDRLYIDQNFIWNPEFNIEHKLIKGAIHIGGDVEINQNFVSSDQHTLVLDGTEGQNVKTGNCSLNNVCMENNSEEGIFFDGVSVWGDIENRNCRTQGTLSIKQKDWELVNTHEGKIYVTCSEDITEDFGNGNTVILSGTYTLGPDVKVNGNLNLEGQGTIAGELEVNGDLELRIKEIGEDAKVYVDGDVHILSSLTNVYGELIATKNLYSKGYIYDYGMIQADNLSSSIDIYVYNQLLVTKNLEINGRDYYSSLIIFPDGYTSIGEDCSVKGVVINGTALEVGGNLNTDSLTMGQESKLKMFGNQLQTIKITKQSSITTLEILNESEEGVYSEQLLTIENLITHGNKIVFGNYEGQVGWTLKGDEVIEDGLTLLTGTLDLNGHHLVVHGDLIQMGGIVQIHGGTLEVTGDYRIQKKEETYGPCPGILSMTQKEDTVIVHGDFYYESNVNRSEDLTDGNIRLYGNAFFNTNYFKASGNHTIILCGDTEQIVRGNNANNSCISGLTIENANIAFENAPWVIGQIDDCGNHIKDTIKISRSATFANGIYHSDVECGLYGTPSLWENVTIFGNYTDNNGRSLNKGEYLTIYGDAKFNTSVNLEGKLTVKKGEAFFDQINLCDGIIDVDGNCRFINFESGSKGTIFVSGNLDIPAPTEELYIILDGKGKQTITTWGKLGTLELRNYSEEGVYSQRTLNVHKLIRNGCRLTYGDIDGEMGWTLTEDVVYQGDFVLIGDTLDLNGHTLTVQGDFIQKTGVLDINKGRLVVQKDYCLAQSNSVNYDYYSTGKLIMDEKQDQMDIYGNALFIPEDASSLQLTDGCMNIHGDFIQLGIVEKISEKNHQINLIGTKEQKIQCFGNPQIANLNIENTSSGGVKLEKDITVTEEISDIYAKLHGEGSVIISSVDHLKEGILGGNLTIIGANELTQDLNVSGKLTLQNNLHIKGHQVHAGNLTLSSTTMNNQMLNGMLYVDNGTVIVDETMSVQNNASLIMQDEEGKVFVGGDFNISTMVSHKGMLTAGTMKIAGNFNQTSAANFIASGKHQVILDGKRLPSGKKLIQSVYFSHPGTATFNIMTLTRKMSEGYNFNCTASRVYKSLSYDIPKENHLSEVTKLCTKSVLTSSVEIEFEDTVNTSVRGYEIYRDNKLVGMTTTMHYLDEGLQPNKAYTYAVYPFDVDGNRSATSPSLVVKTKEDSMAPSAITRLTVTARTGSSITLEWETPEDDSGIQGYELYRNDTCIAPKLMGNTYCDRNLASNTEYRYVVYSIDYAGNRSKSSNEVFMITQAPKILELTSNQGDVIHGRTTLQVYYEDQGDHSKDQIQLSYRSKEGVWKTIANLNAKNVTQSGSRLCGSYVFDSSCIAGEGDYEFKAVVTDGGGTTTAMSKIFYVDNMAPQAPDHLELSSEEGVVHLNWTKSASADSVSYRIYQISSSGFSSLLTTIQDSYTTEWKDVDVTSGRVYTYAVTAVDEAGNESELSTQQSIKVLKDTIQPWVKAITPQGGKIGSKADFYVVAEDNKAVSSIALYYCAELDSEWTLIGRKYEKKSEQSFTWDTRELDEGIYKVMAKVWDEEGNESTTHEEDIQTFTIDHLGPAKVDILHTQADASRIQLEWSIVKDEDFSYYVVEQKFKDGYREIYRTSNQITYMVTGLCPDTEYEYRIVAYDQLDNRGMEALWTKVKTTSDTNQPYITLIGAKRKEGTTGQYLLELSMKVLDDVGISKGIFKVSVDGGKNYEVYEVNADGREESELSYILDVTEYHGKTLHITYQATDTSGNANFLPKDMKDGINITYFVDNEPPKKVQNLHTTGCEGSIELCWDECKDEDLLGYNIYRGDMDTGFERLIAKNVVTHTYVDTSADIGKKYFYKVEAVDKNGNIGMSSDLIYAFVMKDMKAPVILGIAPQNDTLWCNPTLNILVTDNAALSYVKVSYCPKEGGQNINSVIKEWDVQSTQLYEEFFWNTENLPSGEYILKVEAKDQEGNTAAVYNKEYTLDNEAPSTPRLNVENGHYEVKLNMSENKDEDFAHYEILRRKIGDSNFTSIQKTKECQYVDSEILPNTTYYYKVISYDIHGNKSESSICEAMADDEDLIEPKAVCAQNLLGLENCEVMFDGSNSTDNDIVVQYMWDLGDGKVEYGSRVHHVYEKAGTYKVTLTVTDRQGNENICESMVQIKKQGDCARAILTVSDQKNRPISGATVYILRNKNEYATLTTDSLGQVQLVGEPGTYTVMTYSGGYAPKSTEVVIHRDKDSEISITMGKNSIVQGDVSIRRLTLAEMIEKGVDLNNPSNYHTFTFKLTLAFEEKPLPQYVEIVANSSGVISGDVGGGFVYDGGYYWNDGLGTYGIVPVQTESIQNEEPILCYLSITESIAWLMDMYEVDVSILNSAEQDFTLSDCVASIRIPNQLGLAATKNGQSHSIKLGDIQGQEVKQADWIVKGKESGKYDISVDFQANLMPMNVPVRATFEANKEFVVTTGEGLVIYVYPEDAAYIGKNYFVQYEIYNGTGKTLYNFSTTMGSYSAEEGYGEIQIKDPQTGEITVYSSLTDVDENGNEVTRMPQLYYRENTNVPATTHLTYNGEIISVNAFLPGETLYGTYYAPMDNRTNTETPEEVYYKLVEYWVEALEGENLGVQVIVCPVQSHIRRYTYVEPQQTSIVADPIDAATGAFLTNQTAITVSGGKRIGLTMNYNSMMTGKSGELGYGWYHDYDSRIVDYNGRIEWQISPERSVSFMNDEMSSGVIYGQCMENGTILVDTKHQYSGRYSSITYGMEDYYMVREEDGTFTVHIPNGDVWYYDALGNLIRMQDIDGNEVIITTDNGIKTYRDKESGTYLKMYYDEEGHITKAMDPLGNSVCFGYEGGRLTSFTDACGRVTSYEYDLDNRIVKITRDGKEILRNSYDDSGRVLHQTQEVGTYTLSYEDTQQNHIIHITNPAGITITNEMDMRYNITQYKDGNGGVWKYAYTSSGKLLWEMDPMEHMTSYAYDPAGNMTQITKEDGIVTNMEYDVNGNTVKVTNQGRIQYFTYDEKNHLIRSESENGDVESYTYDERGRLLTHNIEGQGKTTYSYAKGRLSSITDSLGNTTKMEYDAAGQLICTTDALENKTKFTYNAGGYTESITDALGNTAHYEYDAQGNVTKTVNSLGGVITSDYDETGNLVRTTDVLGNVTSYTYDGAGNQTKVTYSDGTSISRTYDGMGNILTITNVLGQTSGYTYDAMSNMTVATDSVGRTTTYEYNSNGKLTKVTSPDGNWVAYEYDDRGNCVKESYPNGACKSYTYDIHSRMTSMTNEEEVTIRYGYNGRGQLVQVTDGNGNVTRYGYDALGRCISQINPEGTNIKMVYDALGRMVMLGTVTKNYGEVSIRYEYDALGRVIRTTDEMGNVTCCEYDAMGNLIKLLDEDGSVLRTYTYDQAGNLLEEQSGDGNRNQYTYAKATGELIRLVQNAGDEKQAVYTYEYDVAGRMLCTVDPLGGVTRQTYDESGNVSTVTDANNGVTTYTYDDMNRITKICNAVGSVVSYEYDGEGLLKESVNARGQKTGYRYDRMGRIIEREDEAGKITYGYDNNGNILTVKEELADGTIGTITRTYDSMNRVKSYTDYRGNTIRYGYDELGNLITLTYAGGEIIRYAYYPNGWIKSVTDPQGNLTGYEYDRDGNVTKTVFGDGSVEECTYGAGGRVTRKETRTDAGEVLSCYEYDYDGAGNVITQRGIEPGDETKITTATMTYDAGNRLVTFNGEKVLYDADGNMTYGPLDGEMTHFTYDCRNRLIRAGETTYTYDAENVRTGVKTPEYEEEYLVNTNSELSQILISERIGGAESKVTGYTYGNGLVSQYTKETGTEYYHYDNVGSTMYLTRDGRKTHEFAYGVYGELTKGAYGEVAFMYNGRYGVTTDSNGLYYMRARYYNPTIRRFINQDILTGSITDSQSLNRYAYCQGNPVNYLDPFGLSPYSLFSAVGHTILNLIGFVPLVGDVADGIDAVWYFLEGNYAEAAISGICAIPLVGMMANASKASTSVIRGIRIAGNVGKIYLGGSAGKQNLDNIHKMVVSGNGQWYDYLREGGMLTLNMLSCAMGTSGVMDDVNDIVKQYQKARTQKLADYVSQNTVIGDGFDNPTFKTDDIVSGSGSNTEVFYRTMSQSDYDYLRMTGELPSTGETFISPTKSFSSDYDGVMVKFELNSGTTSMLEKIGLSNGDRAMLAKEVYPDMPYVSGVKWTENYAFFKAEGSQINIGLGKGKALEIFNSNISTFKRVEY